MANDYAITLFATSFFYLMMLFVNKYDSSKKKLIFLYIVTVIINIFAHWFLEVFLGIPQLVVILISQIIIYFIFYFFILEERGMRSVFIASSVASISYIVFITIEIVALWTNLSPSLFIGYSLIVLGFVTWGMYSLSPTIIKLQNTFDKGWQIPALIAVASYALMIFVVEYPCRIHYRPQYYPVILVISLTVIGLHVFLYCLISDLRRVADSRDNEELLFTQKQLDALLLEKKEHYKKIAYYDHLTGLGNRAKLSNDVEKFSEDYTGCIPIVCFAIDINGLKEINDSMGHNAGDKAIKDFADMLTAVFSESGSVYRIGGDEFSVICRGINRGKAEIFLFELEELQKEYNRMHDVKISYAIGYAIQTVKQKNIPNSEQCRACVDFIMRESDERMYSDKQRTKARLLAQKF